jgi:murein L,D-transpeptidase YcbB/YkuD
MIRKEPISERFAARRLAFAPPKWGFAMPRLRLDRLIALRLHNLANGKFDPIIGSAKDRAVIDAFYAGGNYAPLWITEGKANARAKAVIAYLGGVAADGLDPTDYRVPNFDSLTDPAALAEAEIMLTTSVVTYAHHAQIGRVHWSRVSGDIFYDQSAPDASIFPTSFWSTNMTRTKNIYLPMKSGPTATAACGYRIR